MTRRVLRFCRQVLLAILVLLLAAGAGAWLWRLSLAERVAITLAQAQGITLALTVTELDLNHAAVEAIRVGDDRPIKVAAARVDYRLAKLLHGVIDRITADGLDADIVVDENGARLPALAGLDDGGGSGDPPPLPPVQLTKVRVTVDTPQGTVEASGDATVAPAADGQAVKSRFTARLGGNRLQGSLSATRATDGKLAGQLRLDGGTLSQGDIAAALASGNAMFEWNPAQEPLPRGNAELSLPSLRLRDLALGETSVRLISDGQSATADIATTTSGQRLIARVDLQDAAGPAPTAALVATLDLQSFAPFVDLPGRGRIEIDGFAALPPLAEISDLTDLPAEATIRIALAELDIQPLTDGTANAVLRARTTASGLIDVELIQPATLTGTLSEPLTVILQPTETPLASVDLASRQATGALRVQATASPSTATIETDYALAPDGAAWRLSLPDAKLSADELDLPDLTVTGLAASARNTVVNLGSDIAITAPTATMRIARWAAAGQTGALRADATDLAWNPDRYEAKAKVDLAVEKMANIDAALSLAGTGTTVEAYLDACASVRLPPRAIDDIKISSGTLRACPRGTLPLLRQNGDTTVNARLRPSQWRIETPATPLTAELAALDISGRQRGGTMSATVQGSGHRIVADTFQIAAEEIDVNATITGTDGAAKLSIGRIADRKAAPRFAPLRVTADATLAEKAIAANGTITDQKQRATVVFTAKHSIQSGKGNARLASEPPLAFAKGALQPTQLLPLLRGLVTSVDGLLDVQAKAAWDGDDLTSDATVEATAIAAQTPLAVLEGLNGKVAFTSLLPPQTAPRQKVTLAKLDVGLPLNDGQAEFTLRPDGKLELHELGWPWAGGRIRLADEVVDPLADTIAATLRVDDVDLAELARLMDNENVEITGRIGGTIPVEIVGDTVTIREARLASIGGGTIRYVSEGAEAIMDKGGAGSDMLIQALKDFRYDKLIATLDGETTGDLDLAIQVRGANPELYDGYPFELNFAVGGALVEMLRQGLAGYRIPDNIVRELRGEPKE